MEKERTMEKQAWTVKEVARMFSVSERTIWKLCSAGKFPPPIRLGRSVRWTTQALDCFLNKRQLSGSIE